jgi:hypothetical protein
LPNILELITHFLEAVLISECDFDRRKGEPLIHHQQLKEELQNCESRLRQAVRAAKLGFWDYSVADDRLTWSEAIKYQWAISGNEGKKK